jgi:hypothetical protein
MVILSRRIWDYGVLFESAAVAFQRADDAVVPPGLAVPVSLLGVGA